MTLHGIHPRPTGALVERGDLFTAPEVAEVDSIVVAHRLLRMRHHEATDSVGAPIRMDEDSPGSSDRDLACADAYQASLKSDVRDSDGATEEDRVHIRRRISVWAIRVPLSVLRSVLTIEEFSQRRRLRFGQGIMLDDGEVVRHSEAAVRRSDDGGRRTQRRHCQDVPPVLARGAIIA